MWFDKLVNVIKTFIGSSETDVMAALEKKAAAHPELNWRHSIVDLMKLVGQDSSLQARIRLAKELGYGGPFHGEPAMNEFLHQKVLERLSVKPK